jgi:uncharacterized damage-inducible protein DinB
MNSDHTDANSGERSDLLETLRRHRGLLRQTTQSLSDEQARLRPTESQLCLGGVIKHVSRAESVWADFIVKGPKANGSMDENTFKVQAESFIMNEDDSLEGLLAGYEQVALRTDELVESVQSLDDSHPLPERPWFEPGARWSARRVLLHLIAETSQHDGHADIIRESIDGAKTMG